MKPGRGIVMQGSAAVLLARVLGPNGLPIVQADVSTIAVKVWDSGAATQVGATLNPAPIDVVYNALQLDARWSADGTGYNVALTLAGAYWPDTGRYQVEALFTPASGNPFYVIFDLQSLPVFSAAA